MRTGRELPSATGGWSVPTEQYYPLTKNMVKNPSMVTGMPPIGASKRMIDYGLGPGTTVTDPGELFKPSGATYRHYNGIEVGDTVVLRGRIDSPEGTVLNLYEARPNIPIPVTTDREPLTRRSPAVWAHVEWWEPPVGWDMTPMGQPESEVRPSKLAVIEDVGTDMEGL